MSESRTLGEVLGQRLRERREELRRRQDEVARHARLAGLRWTRSSIARVEAGQRDLTFGEMVTLATILDTNLRDLLAGSGRIRIMPGLVVDGDDLFAGLFGDVSLEQVARIPRDLPADFRRTLARHFAKGIEKSKELGRAWPQVPLRTLVTAREAAAGEAEQKAARKLGVHPIDVSLTAFRLWGRSLTEERDRRAQRATPEETPSTLRAARGHVTRSLQNEIDQALKEQGIRRRRSR